MSHLNSRLGLLQGGASTSRISLDSNPHQSTATTNHDQPPRRPGRSIHASDKYDISNLLTDPSSASAFLPSLPSLSQNTYLPTQLTSLGTAFTSSGTMPRSTAPAGKSVVQRRSQAPPLAQTELKKVGKEDFAEYLKEIGDDYGSWVRESRAAKEDTEEEEEGTEGGQSAEEGGSPKKQTSKKRRKRRDQEELESLPPLDQVPSIFFDPSFNLSNPRTFDLVTERIQLTPSSSPSLTFSPRLPSTIHDSSDELVIPGLGPTTLNDLASDQLLQEKLSHFTAVIESHLVREIGLRSSSFFSALSNLQHLHHQGSSTLTKIEELKSKLGDKEGGVSGTARHGLKILRLQARRRGLERIEESVRAVEEVASALEGVKELVENGEWSDALEVAESIQEAYEKSALPAQPLPLPPPPAAASSSSSSSTSPLPPPPPSSSGSSTLPTTTTRTSTSSSSSLPASRNQPLNLTKLTALRSLPLKLSLIRAQIAKSLEGELISVLEHEMDLGIESGIKQGRTVNSSAEADDTEGGGGIVDTGDEGFERMKERTRPVVKALVRSEGMDSAVQAWRESVLREVRAMVREHLPTGEEGGGGDQEDEDPFASAAVRSVSKQSIDLGTISDKSLSLAKKLRAMSHEAFLRLAQETYLGLIACIETVNLQCTVLLELVSHSREEERIRRSKRWTTNSDTGTTLPQSPPPTHSSSSLTVRHANPSSSPSPTSPSFSATSSPVMNGNSEDPATSLSSEITDVLAAVTELSNVRFSKVIGVRSEVHSQLPLSQFLEIFDQTWSFVLRCEVVVKRMIVGLRGAMVSQSKGWLMTFHQKRINENAKLVEEEQWSASEVPLRTQRTVELIVAGAMIDPEELLLGQRRGGGSKAKVSAEGEEERAAVAKQVDIEGRQFFAVSAGLATIETLSEYLQVVLNCPMLTTDAMSKIIEFMKVFNSRSCQVVLGAGAMRSAGLKNITAKNLALASQALSIMVSLIPYIRELIRRHLSPKQAVMLTEFDKLKRDYQEHQNEIHFKLVAIMSDRLVVHSRTLDNLDWEQPSANPGQPNTYMESLVKEHLTLYKVLSRFLHAETVFSIMSQVFKALDSKLGEEYERIDFKSELAKERVLVDVKYLQEKLGGLKGLEENGPGKVLETLVAAKSLPAKAIPPRASTEVDDSAPALRPPPAAIETPLPVTPSLWTSLPPSASTSALSLALPDAPSTPRTSLDAPPSSDHSPPARTRNRSPSPGPQPPSPVPIPAPLPPSPKPGPTPYKKKSLAERLAERMGRKPVEAVPPQQSSRNSVEFESREPEAEQKQSEDEKLLEEVQKEIPVWTPKGEKELEEVERQVQKEVEAEGLGISSLEAIKIDEPKPESEQEVIETEAKLPDDEPVTGQHADEERSPTNQSAEEVAQQRSDPIATEEPSATESQFEEPLPSPSHLVSNIAEFTSERETNVPKTVPEERNPTLSETVESSQAEQSEEPNPASLIVEPPTPEEVSANEKTFPTETVSAESLEKEEEKTKREVQDAPSDCSEAPEASNPNVPPTEYDDVEAVDAKPVRSSAPEPSSISSPPAVPPLSIPAASEPAPSPQPPTSITSPPSHPAPSTTLPEVVSPTSASSNPPRKKTLKERLAEAARRGSTGNSLVNVTSPPLQPSRPSLDSPLQKERELKEGVDSNGSASTPSQSNTVVNAVSDSAAAEAAEDHPGSN